MLTAQQYLRRYAQFTEGVDQQCCFLTSLALHCPGLHLVDASVWISVVMSLAVFDISKVVENGVEITPKLDPTLGTISHPKPFKCSIKPRSAKAIALIQQDANY
ncbi:hypothetical protein AZE42_05787 [Rhizopogon vesiculosus]|uniref:Uncharacterized protein n=1 Tax=Rhizopogon vesiculosus TaxID=180088 RepID=A0A1J8QII5_9AGAM|nr:hypothetical protein AZE42_05787 [Rhizopogon vesiculosus]